MDSEASEAVGCVLEIIQERHSKYSPRFTSDLGEQSPRGSQEQQISQPRDKTGTTGRKRSGSLNVSANQGLEEVVRDLEKKRAALTERELRSMLEKYSRAQLRAIAMAYQIGGADRIPRNVLIGRIVAWIENDTAYRKLSSGQI